MSGNSSPTNTTGTGNDYENEAAIVNRDITNAVNNDNHFDDDDDLGITEETAAAIDSIVSSIDVVEELQDDVDLGLDVIEDGDVSDHQETSHDQTPDQQSLVEV